jgi:hemerythrin-like domain-containing protein
MTPQPHDDAHPADALAMLKADHQRIRDLCAQYEATTNSEMQWTIAEDVLGELEVHAQLEEQIFYPAIADQSDEGERLAQGSLEEHQILRHLIQELRGMGPQFRGFDAKFKVLVQNVEDHVADEEAELLPFAEVTLQEDLGALLAAMQAFKAQLLAS